MYEKVQKMILFIFFNSYYLNFLDQFRNRQHLTNNIKLPEMLILFKSLSFKLPFTSPATTADLISDQGGQLLGENESSGNRDAELHVSHVPRSFYEAFSPGQDIFSARSRQREARRALRVPRAVLQDTC